MPTVRQKLAQRVRFLRKDRKWTQEQLAEKARLTYKFIGQIERAEVSPSLDSLDKLAKAFGVPLSQLLSFEKAKAAKTREEIFQELSKGEMEAIKRAVEILGRVFR